MDDSVIELIDGIEIEESRESVSDNPGEVWKDINGWTLHQVSNKGRIRILPGGSVNSRIIYETEIRKITSDSSTGYMQIQRWDNKKKIKYYVHRLVLEAFVGLCPLGEECRHLNGDRSDNRWPENLAWGTHDENYGDRIKHGTDSGGERHPQSKLTQVQVDNIKSRPRYRGINVDLAIEFGVSKQAIWDIRNGKRWNKIEPGS